MDPQTTIPRRGSGRSSNRSPKGTGDRTGNDAVHQQRQRLPASAVAADAAASAGPYTPPGYNAPWAPPPRKTSAGIPWVVLGVGAVVFMAVAGGVGWLHREQVDACNSPISPASPSRASRAFRASSRRLRRRRAGEHGDHRAVGWADQRRRRRREQDDRVQRQPRERQRRLQHRHDHRPLRERHGVRHAESTSPSTRPIRSMRPASTTWSPTTPAHRTSIPADPTWSSKAELSGAFGPLVGIGEREHGAFVGERGSRHE